MGRPKKKDSQYNKVLNHIYVNGEITSMEAFDTYGITRLAAIVHTLKKDGYNIKTDIRHDVNRYGEACHYAAYSMVK